MNKRITPWEYALATSDIEPEASTYGRGVGAELAQLRREVEHLRHERDQARQVARWLGARVEWLEGR